MEFSVFIYSFIYVYNLFIYFCFTYLDYCLGFPTRRSNWIKTYMKAENESTIGTNTENESTVGTQSVRAATVEGLYYY